MAPRVSLPLVLAFAVVLLLFAAAPARAQSYGSNVLSRANAESYYWRYSWYNDAWWDRTDYYSHGGWESFFLDDTDPWGFGSMYQDVSVSSYSTGDVWTATAWLFNIDNSPAEGKLEFEFRDGSTVISTLTRTMDRAGPSGSTWYQWTDTITQPAGATSVRLRLSTENKGLACWSVGGGCFLFDDIEFSAAQGQAPTPAPDVCGDGQVTGSEECETGDCCDTSTCMFKSSATLCRPAADSCDAAEYCSGSSNSCPTNGFASSGTSCNDGNSCTSNDQCDGSGTCGGTDTCGCGNGVVNAGEECDLGAQNGASGSCCTSTCTFAPASTLCRASAHQCDADEFCTGSSTTCPTDENAIGRICDDGNDSACEGDDVCTASGCEAGPDICVCGDGVVDADESCDDGADNGSEASCCTSTCTFKASGSKCDDGFSDACHPQNSNHYDTCSVTGVCQPATSICVCGNGVVDSGEECEPNQGPCCTSDCKFVDASDLVVCREGTTDAICDVAETCDGTSASCPANQYASSGTACNDGDPCTSGDTCSGSGICNAGPTNVCGTCGDGTVTGDEECDEGSSSNGGADSCCTSSCTFKAVGSGCSSSSCDVCGAGGMCQAQACGSEVYGENLLTNSDASSSPSTGWTTVSGSWTTANWSPGPKTGSNYFYPGKVSDGIMYQEVDVSAYPADTSQFTFTVWLAGYANENDVAYVTVEYRDGSGNVLASADHSTVTTTTWTEWFDSRTLPLGTSKIRIELEGQRSGGDAWNDAYFDAMSLVAETVSGPSESQSASPVPSTPPTVLNVDPASNAGQVALTTAVHMEFSEAMNTGSVAGKFKLKKTSNGATVSGSLSWTSSDRMLAFTPGSTLAGGTQYTIEVLSGALDANGDALASTFSSTFTTFNPDQPAPFVVSTTPSNGEEGVTFASVVKVVFSQPMDRDDTAEAFSLVDFEGEDVAGSIAWTQGDTVLTFTPSQPFMPSYLYTLLVEADEAEAASGQEMEGDYSAFFTTLVPDGPGYGDADFEKLTVGIWWFGKAVDNTPMAQRWVPGVPNKFFDPTRPISIVVSHGWQKDFLKNGDDGVDDGDIYRGSYVKLKNKDDLGLDIDLGGPLYDLGYNLGFFYWSQLAAEGEVKDAEGKIHSSTATSRKMRWRDRSGQYRAGPENKSVADLLADNYVSNFADYTGEIRLSGHSLGCQIVYAATARLHDKVQAGTWPASKMPARLTSFDGFFSKGDKSYLGKSAGKQISDWADVFSAAPYNMALEAVRSSELSGGWVSGDKNGNWLQKVAYSELEPDYFGGFAFGEKHGAAMWSYFWQGHFGPYVIDATSPTEYGGGLRSTNDRIRELMSAPYKLHQKNGKKTKTPGDDTYSLSSSKSS